MSDRNTSNSGNEARPRSRRELARLIRGVDGLLDADRLLVEDGDALLPALAAAGGAVEEGELAAARRGIEALVQCGMLEEASGRAALEAARPVLMELSGGAAPAPPAGPLRDARKTTQKRSLRWNTW